MTRGAHIEGCHPRSKTFYVDKQFQVGVGQQTVRECCLTAAERVTRRRSMFDRLHICNNSTRPAQASQPQHMTTIHTTRTRGLKPSCRRFDAAARPPRCPPAAPRRGLPAPAPAPAAGRCGLAPAADNCQQAMWLRVAWRTWPIGAQVAIQPWPTACPESLRVMPSLCAPHRCSGPCRKPARVAPPRPAHLLPEQLIERVAALRRRAVGPKQLLEAHLAGGRSRAAEVSRRKTPSWAINKKSCVQHQ
jgi:hypothetical protein